MFYKSVIDKDILVSYVMSHISLKISKRMWMRHNIKTLEEPVPRVIRNSVEFLKK